MTSFTHMPYEEMKGTQEVGFFFFFRCTKFDPFRTLYDLKCTVYLFLYYFVTSCCRYLDYPYIFKDDFGCKQYQKFYFCVSIHDCSFGEMAWATEMWGRGIMCTSLEIKHIFFPHFLFSESHVFLKRKWTLNVADCLVRTVLSVIMKLRGTCGSPILTPGINIMSIMIWYWRTEPK